MRILGDWYEGSYKSPDNNLQRIVALRQGHLDFLGIFHEVGRKQMYLKVELTDVMVW